MTAKSELFSVKHNAFAQNDFPNMHEFFFTIPTEFIMRLLSKWHNVTK